MERKIGEKFIHEGILLEVVKDKCGCTGCFFLDNPHICNKNSDIAGNCIDTDRSDSTGVIFKKVKEDKTMTKSDLKPGMVVECRDGDKLIVLNDKVTYGLDVYMTLNRHNDDLTSKNCKNNDIVKVYQVPNNVNGILEALLKGRLDSSLSLIWERSEEVILTMKQIAEKFNVDVKQLKIKE